jgi:hypothetical protein
MTTALNSIMDTQELMADWQSKSNAEFMGLMKDVLAMIKDQTEGIKTVTTAVRDLQTRVGDLEKTKTQSV